MDRKPNDGFDAPGASQSGSTSPGLGGSGGSFGTGPGGSGNVGSGGAGFGSASDRDVGLGGGSADRAPLDDLSDSSRFGSTGGSSGAGSSGFGASGGSATPGYSSSEFSTATGADYADSSESAQTQSARDRLHQARDRAGEKLGQARDKAGELKLTLADKLEAGAEKLRTRSTTGTPSGMAAAGVDAGTTEVAAQPDPMAQAGEKLATGMRSTADWLRNNDLESVKTNIEKEVRTNPGRSLLVAAVAGYLLGKAFRR